MQRSAVARGVRIPVRLCPFFLVRACGVLVLWSSTLQGVQQHEASYRLLIAMALAFGVVSAGRGRGSWRAFARQTSHEDADRVSPLLKHQHEANGRFTATSSVTAHTDSAE